VGKKKKSIRKFGRKSEGQTPIGIPMYYLDFTQTDVEKCEPTLISFHGLSL
jgi:hypothetical protein